MTDGIILSSPALCDGVLYFGCFDEYLYAVSINEQSVLWKLKTDGIVVSSPIIKDGIIYFGSCDSYFYAVSIDTYEILWKFKTENQICGDAIIDGDKIYFGSTDQYIYCISFNGILIWKVRANGEFLMGEPHIVGSKIYISASDGSFYAFDKKSGEFIWKFLSGDEAYCCISSDENLIYFGSRDRHLYAFDKNTHECVWKFRANHSVVFRPIVTKDRVYVVSDKFYALDKNGVVLWNFPMSEGDDFYSFAITPMIYNNKLYFASFDGHFRCLDMNGILLWKFKTKAQKMFTLVSGAFSPAAWWGESSFSVFEDVGESFAPIESYAICARYGTEVISNLESVIEANRYLEMGASGAYKELENKTYVGNLGSYVEKINKDDKNTQKWKKVFDV